VCRRTTKVVSIKCVKVQIGMRAPLEVFKVHLRRRRESGAGFSGCARPARPHVYVRVGRENTKVRKSCCSAASQISICECALTAKAIRRENEALFSGCSLSFCYCVFLLNVLNAACGRETLFWFSGRFSK
jgi:hypothetical protein